MKARMVLCWHPDSPGGTVIVRRRFRRKRPFATLTETIIYLDWLNAMVFDGVKDVRDIKDKGANE